jgi:hypothetical protein
MKIYRLKLCLVLLASAASLSGCGTDPDKPKLGRVWGKVTYNGKAVTKGVVSFVPSGGPGAQTGQPATGEIGADGSYSLTTFESGDGAVLGEHKVIVQAREDDPALKGHGMPIPDKDGRLNIKPPTYLVPRKYETAEKSPLRFTVKEGSNTYNIDLTD